MAIVTKQSLQKTRTATYVECYMALRQNGLDIIGSVFFAVILVMRNTQIELSM